MLDLNTRAWENNNNNKKNAEGTAARGIHFKRKKKKAKNPFGVHFCRLRAVGFSARSSQTTLWRRKYLNISFYTFLLHGSLQG